MENRAFKIAGIKNLIKRNYNVSTSELDINALVDDSISMSENWYNIKDKVLMLCNKENKLMFLD